MPTAAGTAVSATTAAASVTGPSSPVIAISRTHAATAAGDQRRGVGEPLQLPALDPRGAPQPDPHRGDGADEGGDRAERGERQRHADDARPAAAGADGR